MKILVATLLAYGVALLGLAVGRLCRRPPPRGCGGCGGCGDTGLGTRKAQP